MNRFKTLNYKEHDEQKLKINTDLPLVVSQIPVVRSYSFALKGVDAVTDL